MSLSLYEISVPAFRQAMGVLDVLLDKGAAHCEANKISIEDMLNARLNDTMRPFKSQIVYSVIFPKMTLASLRSGEFSRSGRNNLPDDLEFAELKNMVEMFSKELDAVSTEEVNALAKNTVMINKLPDIDRPFMASEFVLSFTLPNLFFHVSTAYDILRMRGVPLEKRDVLGDIRRLQ